jgi:hypothetical protein
MNVGNILEYLRQRASLLRNLFFLFLAILVLFDVLLPREHAHFFVDRIYAYWTFFGIAGCFLLIKFSKGIAHLFLSKDEDYYE